MKSTWVSTSQRMRASTTSLLPTARVEPRPLRDRLEPRILAVVPSHLRRRHPVRDHDVAREIVRAANERRADAVGVDRDALVLEFADLRLAEAAGRDDPHVRVARGVERVAHLPDEALVHAGRLEVAQLVEKRTVDERLRRVETHTPEAAAERIRHLERGPHRIVLEVDKHG